MDSESACPHWARMRRLWALRGKRLLRSALVSGAACTGFMNRNRTETFQHGGKSIPYPDRDAFAGRVFQPFHIIQVVVVKFLQQWFEGCLNCRKVCDPAGMLVHWPGHSDLDTK